MPNWEPGHCTAHAARNDKARVDWDDRDDTHCEHELAGGVLRCCWCGATAPAPRGEPEVHGPYVPGARTRLPPPTRTPTPDWPAEVTVALKCPDCDAPMVKRLARRGRNAGLHFWGCTRYPKCTGSRNEDGTDPGELETGEDGPDEFHGGGSMEDDADETDYDQIPW